jgi:glycosyltransferase involved in cell wall biosynthesis
VSDTVARQVRRAVGIEVPVTVVPNGIATRSWPARRPVEWGAPLRVVAVGRLAPRKRMPALLRALRAASARLGNGALTVRIAGAGPVGPWMRSYLTWHGMTGWVSLLGELPRREVPGLLADSDVFVTMAVHEASGLGALEARTVGVPILARRDSGIAKLVEHGRKGLLASDNQGVVNALVHLAEDPQLLRRLRAADPAQAYDWSVVLAPVDACYSAATATLSPRPA